MTDKQIIIDGVDVSGCECYSEHREGYCGWHIPCEGDTCLYKLKWALQQLKHKEQENEELKEKNNTLLGELQVAEESLKDYEAHYNRQCEQVDKLEKENKELKFYIERYKHIWELDKYKQVFKEIKETAEKYKNLNFGEQQYCYKDILQKISEVINDKAD